VSSGKGAPTITNSGDLEAGQRMFELCKELWPLNRSLTGPGNRETLQILAREFPEIEIFEVPSGVEAFDWNVPQEWSVNEAWIKGPAGEVIADFSVNNLHLVGYSSPVHARLSLEELQSFLHTLPAQPDAIPYVTSYYNQTWGFCISENQRQGLAPGTYEVLIDSKLFSGAMSYGEIFLPGENKSEVLLSTYICHPSMANNELSGIAVSLQLARDLKEMKQRENSYRVLFLPETIGAIYYLSQNLANLQENVIAGYVVTCVGDERGFSYVPSRKGDSYADKVAHYVLDGLKSEVTFYEWKDRQSDERQYSAPLVDLPVGSIMRSKYGSYPEYHTSLDTLGDVVTPAGLAGARNIYLEALRIIEANFKPLATTFCEPQLGKRGLYPNIGKKGVYEDIRVLRDLLSWSDGSISLLEIAQKSGHDFWALHESATLLLNEGLVQNNSVRT